MRPALLLLAATSVIAVAMWRLRVERPDLAMAAQQKGPDEPLPLFGYATPIGHMAEPPVSPPSETELERFQRQRALYLRLYPRLGEVLQLDAKTESDLYDLLATQGLDFRGGEEDPPEIQDRVATEKDAALEKMLGEHTFRRFDEYRRMPATGDVARLNESLGEERRVRGEAIWRLTKLIHDNSIYGAAGPVTPSSYQVLPPEVAGSPRSRTLITLAQQEDHFRIQERWRRRIEEEATGFLTVEQLDALKRSHAETALSWRVSIGQLRAEVGMTHEVPLVPEENYLGIIRRRIPIPQDVRSALTVSVNGESVRFEHTGANSERFGFQASNGLWVDAIATLYDDGWLEMLLAYSETRRGKQRQLDQWVRMEASSSAPHDSATETHRGLVEYKIQAMGITATALGRR